MTGKPSPPDSPFATASMWVSRVVTISLEMVLPGLVGVWLDSKLASSPLLTVAGFAGGMVLGVWHLLSITRQPPPGQGKGT